MRIPGRHSHLPAGGEAVARRRARALPHAPQKTQEPPETGGSASCGRAYTCGSESFSTGASSTLRIAQRAMTICVLAEPTANTTV